MAKVQVSRGVLIGLAAALGSSLLALVFLLGREAGRRGAAAAPVVPASQLPGAVRPAVPGAPAAPVPLPDAVAAALAVPPGLADPQDPQRAAVAAYFDAVDHIAPGQLGGDPQALAQEMLAGLVKGDSSGFDKLIAQAEEARRKLAGLVPPPPCAGVHQESLAEMDESLGQMRAIRKAIEGAEGGGSMASLMGRAQGLQARSEALERAVQALKQRYGIAR